MESLVNGHDVEPKRVTVPTKAKVSRKAAGRSTTPAPKDSTSSEAAGDESGRRKAAVPRPKPKRADKLERVFPGVRCHLIAAKGCLAPLAEKIVAIEGGEHIENLNEMDEMNNLVEEILRISQEMRRAVLKGEAVRYNLDLYSQILAACERVYDLGNDFVDSGSPAVATELLFKAASVVALLETARVSELYV